MTPPLLLFAAESIALVDTLWSLDASSNPNQINPSALFPHDFVAYGGAVYFNGSSGSRAGLWVTDGSSAHEINGILNTPVSGVDPSGPVTFNNLMYFNGQDSAGIAGLWVSDGTVANTHEIALANANSNGIFTNGTDPGFVVFNDSLYFAGQDTGNIERLWTSGGTAATTQVVAVPDLESPADLVSFNGSLYFNGFGPLLGFHLWKSDGTAAGTHSFTVADEVPAGLNPTDLTPYTSAALGGSLLFFAGAGVDPNGSGLWFTDGTEVGTHEITGLPGGFTHIQPFDLTVYDGLLYFDAKGADGESDLWVSDGTAVGTHEIIVAGANYGGADGGFRPEDFTVFNGLLYFSGRVFTGTASGHDVLWVTDGTNVHQVPLGPLALPSPHPTSLFAATFGAPDLVPSVTINQAAGQSDPATRGPIRFDVVFSEAVTGFDGSDISFTGSSAPGTLTASVTGSGATYIVSVSGMTGNGTLVASIGAGAAQDVNGAPNTAATSTDNTVAFSFNQNGAAPINWLGSPGTASHPAGWQLAGVGDFNHDGISDLLWRETVTGRVDEWQLASGGQWQQSINLGTHGASWQVAGVADFTGDGTSDVLWRDSATGHLDLWVMVNGQWSQSNDLDSHGTDWTVLGVGDFNGDHTSDILFQNTTSGQLDSWKMANGQWAGSMSLGSQTTPWNFGGIGDANADGTSDIVWRNASTGQVSEWHMEGGNWAQTLDLGSFNPAFELAAVNDFNGDGTADILWRNPTSGQVETWALLNGTVSSSSSLGSFDPAFRLAGTGDINHDGGADVIWHNAATGQVGEWLLGS